LTARGLRPGTAAWNAARNQFSEGKNDAYNQLLLSGRAQATDELSREWQSGLQGNQQRFGQLVGARTLGMGEQGQQFGQEVQKQGSNIDYLTRLLQAGQPNMPQFTGSQPGASPYMDYGGAINNNWDQQFKSWAQESANKGNLGGGLLGLAGKLGGAAIASDERIKDNIKQVGKTQDGLPIYEFSIGDGEMQTGVMAQDVEAVDPSAVVQDPATGIKGVNYDQAVGDGTGTYTVEKGDNIWDIGERLGVDPREIIAANPDIQNPDFIVPGQQLVVPGMAAPGPAAIPMSALPAAGAATGIPAVASALAAPAGPGMMPPGGGMPAAPMTEPVSAPPAVPAQVNTPEQAQAMEELIRLFPERFQRTPSGGMGAY
jgi:LysM repeat protein